MSTISASTTTTTAYKVTADTTGTLVLQTGSGPTTALTIDTSQNVGIGTSSPSAKLDVTTSTAGFAAILTNTNGASDSNGLYIKSGTGSTEYNLRLSNTSGSTDFMVVKGNGNVGIGVTSPSARLAVQVSGMSNPIVIGQSNSSNYGSLSFNGNNNDGGRIGFTAGFSSNQNLYYDVTGSGAHVWRYGNNPDEAMRLNSSGSLLLGATSSSGNAERLFAKGSGTGSSTYTAIFSNSASTYIFGARDDGAIYTPTIGTSTGTALILTASGFIAKSSSSIRYKKDVEPIDIGLDFVLGLEPVKYNLKDGDIPQVGFIAEDFPDTRLVSESMVDPQDETKGSQREGVNYANLVAPLVKAIQEQQALIQTLTERITALENK